MLDWIHFNYEPVVLTAFILVDLLLIVNVFYSRKSANKTSEVKVSGIDSQKIIAKIDHEAIIEALRETVKDSVSSKLKPVVVKKAIPTEYSKDRFNIKKVGDADIPGMNVRIDVFNIKDSDSGENFLLGIYEGRVINLW